MEKVWILQRIKPHYDTKLNPFNRLNSILTAQLLCKPSALTKAPSTPLPLPSLYVNSSLKALLLAGRIPSPAPLLQIPANFTSHTRFLALPPMPPWGQGGTHVSKNRWGYEQARSSACEIRRYNRGKTLQGGHSLSITHHQMKFTIKACN